MTSHEEREETLKTIREGGIARNEAEAYVLLLHCIGIRPQLPAVNTYKPALERLADLIDPTCKNKQIETNKMAPIEFKADNFICSNCGEIFCADKEGINAPIDWSYCPNCGARVVCGNHD